ncbi:DUF1311 domain-containing protein [Bartonella sp. HY329]|uniref:lysozyme inhibitor LprI family protein n=1 Tax=unclassified Bartonella TaxID=2645622 RepID=UPI0021C679A9|nr:MULTISPECIES: lysozyme inhibitor LprI family protein [unclassified Bartonella]UXM95860.1 DUF1311 domain-containing protein [Bartonella sp. HY329]UXN10185.1 DUF1311 domain-containing protein [Bartonella sp. HY328]
MSKIIYGLLLLLFGFTVFSSSKSAHADALYDKCLDDKADGTNFDWRNCGVEYFERIDIDLNITWREVIDSYQSHPNGEKIKKQLKDQQRLWITFKEQSCQPFFDGFRGREGQVMHFFGCRGAIVEDRIAQLKQFYCNDDATCHFSDYEIDDLLSDIEISDWELNKAYQYIRKRLDDIFSDTENDEEFKQFNPPAISLLNEQRAWVKFKDKACLFMNDLNPDVASPKPIFRINRCKDLITRHRQEELSFYCDMADCFLPNKPVPNKTGIDHNQWEIGCDQSYSCTAVGYKSTSQAFADYIVIKWQFNSNKPAKIRIIFNIYNSSQGEKDKNYQAFVQFKQSKIQDISSYFIALPSAASTINDSVEIIADNHRINDIFNGLLNQKTLAFGNKNLKGNTTTINLSAFQQFYREMKDYVDFFYPKQVVSLPKIKAYRLFIDDDNAKKPQILLQQREGDNCFDGFSSDKIFHASNGDRFYALCYYSAKNNASYEIYSIDQNYKSYPREKIDNKSNVNSFENPFSKSKITMTLADSTVGLGNRHCGTASNYSYTPDGFRLSEVRQMQPCIGIPLQDWPIIYKLNVEEIRQ